MLPLEGSWTQLSLWRYFIQHAISRACKGGLECRVSTPNILLCRMSTWKWECRVSTLKIESGVSNVRLTLSVRCRPIFRLNVGCRIRKIGQCRVSGKTPLWDLLAGMQFFAIYWRRYDIQVYRMLLKQLTQVCLVVLYELFYYDSFLQTTLDKLVMLMFSQQCTARISLFDIPPDIWNWKS